MHLASQSVANGGGSDFMTPSQQMRYLERIFRNITGIAVMPYLVMYVTHRDEVMVGPSLGHAGQARTRPLWDTGHSF